MSKPADRSGDEYGSVKVIGRDAENPRMWRIRWGCCGKEQVVTSTRCYGMSKTVPLRCIVCWRKVDANNDDYSKMQSERRQKYLALKNAANNHPEDLPKHIVVTPGGGWWPELGRMGGRMG